MRFMIEPLSTNADESPVMGGGHSEMKTETDFQNIAHPLASSPSSPDIIEQGHSSSHVSCNKGGNTTTCRGLSRGSRVKGRATVELTGA